jgi:CBS-domain-containing membrane protein
MYTASDLMTPNPFVIPASARVGDALRALQELEVRHLPVVNSEGALVGMLSDRDLRGLAVPVLIDGEWLGTVRLALDASVQSMMNSDVFSVGIEAEVEEIVDLILGEKVGAVPVLDADGKLAGIVSYVDLLSKLELVAPKDDDASDQEVRA